ncbi:MAG: insulinase family protein, partial [Kofleriaceae bacterium]
PDAEAFAKTGVGVGCETTPDATICLSRGINIYLEVMLKGLERLITAGTYDQEAIERWQKSMRGQLATRSAQQRLELQRQVLSALYGPQHPYTTTGLVTPEAIGKVSKDRLDEFRRGHLTAGNATLVIVGDFDPAQAERLARASFGGWDKGTIDPPVNRQLAARTGPIHVGVIGKDDPQLSIQLAYPAPAGVDGQEGARQVLAEMIQIRVADVRFKLGTTYGVRVGRRAHTGPSAYSVAGTVDAERAGESIRAIRDNIEQLRKGGTTFDVDFVRARRKVISRLLGESTVTAEIAARLGFIAQFGLDEKFFTTMLHQVAIVSVAQIQALVDKELAADREIVVVLGDRPHLDRAFKDAGLTARLVEPVYQ